jgi:hypothetical protein
MAKLNGIQVIDMVGGKVTKISYNGEEYAKVAEQDGEIYPKAGDIALRTKSSMFLELGGYYEVDSLVDGLNPRLVGRNGNYFDRENFTFFRKATPAPATKPASEVKVGDKIRIVACDDHRYKNGDEMDVNDVRGDGAVYATINDRSHILVLAREFEVIDDQPSETDKRITDLEQRVTALESAKPAPPTPHYRKVTDRSPQVGDYVKYDEAPAPYEDYLTAGKYYEIIRLDADDPVIIDDDGDEHDTYEEDFEVYEKVKQTDKQSQPTQDDTQQSQALKVGDYAKVVDQVPFSLWNYKDGDIVKVTKFRDDDYIFVQSDGKEEEHMAPAQLVPATDEEVAEAKAAAKFAEIGRKPGEFKAGDIVKTERYGILEVTEVLKGNIFPIGAIVNGEPDKLRADSCELITPVERRFDR